jgi:hypothetical protein
MKQIYREDKRIKAIELIKNSDLFSHGKAGFIIGKKGKEYQEILLDGINNVYAPIRDGVLDYFTKNKFDFWRLKGEPQNKPTGHTLSSQVCCINHLFPIRQDKENVLKIAKFIAPDIVDIFPIETDEISTQGYILFEAVSDKDHLNELNVTRGSNCTSIDALIYGQTGNHEKIILPIEWKYTEYYNNEDKSIEDQKNSPKGNEKSGKERLKRYSQLINNSTYLKYLEPLRGSLYFFEPFYQLMRQTLWTEQMLNHKDSERIKADNYIHVHIIPKENIDLLDKKYKITNKNMEESWRECLKFQNKYRIISPIEILKCIDKDKYSDLLEYLKERYWSEQWSSQYGV